MNFFRKPKQENKETETFSAETPIYYADSLHNGQNLFNDTANPLATDVVLACISLRSDILASLPIEIYQEKGDQRVKIGDHSLNRLFEKPNKYQTSYEFIEYAQQSFDHKGNFYGQIIRNGKGEVLEIIPLNPDLVVVSLQSDGTVLYNYNSEVTFQANEVLHVKDGGGILTGLSKIDLLVNTLGIYNSAETHSKNLLDKGAKLSGVIESSAVLKKETRDALAESLNTNYSGSNSNKTLVLSNGLTFKPITMSNADAELLKTREFEASRIAAVFRVPLHLIHLDTKMSYQSNEANNQHFVTWTLRGLIKRYEAAMNQKLLTDRDKKAGVSIRFNLDALLRANLTDRYSSYQTGIQNSFLTPNECRRLENLPPIEGGDSLLQPLNMGNVGTQEPSE